MKHRTFPIRDTQCAYEYIRLLLDNGVTFTVAPNVSRVDISTPFNLQPDLFPVGSQLNQGKLIWLECQTSAVRLT